MALVAALALVPTHAQAFSHGGGGHGGGGGHFSGGFHGGGFHGGFAARRGDWLSGLNGFGSGWSGDPGFYVDGEPIYPSYSPGPSYPPGYAAATQPWYYCQSPAGYYPYVQQCAGAWQPVAPQS
jgi:hypothetical protein